MFLQEALYTFSEVGSISDFLRISRECLLRENLRVADLRHRGESKDGLEALLESSVTK